MADTLQSVQWALEQACPLRRGEAVEDVEAAANAVGEAAGLGRSLAKPDRQSGVFGDVFVSGVTVAALPTGIRAKEVSMFDRLLGRKKKEQQQYVDYPSMDYLISDIGEIHGDGDY